jgi:hypothetical protein
MGFSDMIGTCSGTHIVNQGPSLSESEDAGRANAPSSKDRDDRTSSQPRVEMTVDARKDRAQFSINARECVRCEREWRHNQSIIRIVRLKTDGNEHAPLAH